MWPMPHIQSHIVSCQEGPIIFYQLLSLTKDLCIGIQRSQAWELQNNNLSKGRQTQFIKHRQHQTEALERCKIGGSIISGKCKIYGSEEFSSCAKVLPFWLGSFSKYSKELHFVFQFHSFKSQGRISESKFNITTWVRRCAPSYDNCSISCVSCVLLWLWAKVTYKKLPDLY